MKKITMFIIMFAISLTLSSTYIKAETTNVTIGEEFTIANDSGKTLSGIITTDESFSFDSIGNIKTDYQFNFTGSVTTKMYDQTPITLPYSGTFSGRLAENRFGITEIYVNAFVIVKNNGELYCDVFSFKCEVEIINTSADTKPESPDTEIVIDQPTTFTTNNSSTSTLPYFYIAELRYETEEVDEEDNVIERSYTDDILDWVTQNVHLYNADGTELPIRDIWFSKNITNLKYGEKNAYIYIDTADEYYKSSKIKVTVNYEPELEIDDVTRTKIVAVPINGAEYSIDGTTWQKSNKFTKLTKDTEYTVYFRQKGDTTGDSIRSITITTEAD